MKLPTFSNSDFKKSSLCCEDPHCVEVAQKAGIVAVKHSKKPNQTALYFNTDEWTAFINGVKKGEFDF